MKCPCDLNKGKGGMDLNCPVHGYQSLKKGEAFVIDEFTDFPIMICMNCHGTGTAKRGYGGSEVPHTCFYCKGTGRL